MLFHRSPSKLTIIISHPFCRLFETNHDIKDMFAAFKDVTTLAELRSSKVLESHAMKVICTIDDVIVNLDDMDYVLRMLQIVAQSHSQRFPNFNPEFFWVSLRANLHVAEVSCQVIMPSQHAEIALGVAVVCVCLLPRVVIMQRY